jgi:hypothetical protein
VFPNPQGRIVRFASVIKHLKHAGIAAHVVTADGKPKYTGLHWLRSSAQGRAREAKPRQHLYDVGYEWAYVPAWGCSGVLDVAEGLLLG